MELYIQMGHNTGKLAIEHLEDFGNGTVVLSPMNIVPKNIRNYSDKVHKKNGRVLIDPQLYYPRKFHKKLSVFSLNFADNYILIRDIRICTISFAYDVPEKMYILLREMV